MFEESFPVSLMNSLLDLTPDVMIAGVVLALFLSLGTAHVYAFLKKRSKTAEDSPSVLSGVILVPVLLVMVLGVGFERFFLVKHRAAMMGHEEVAQGPPYGWPPHGSRSGGGPRGRRGHRNRMPPRDFENSARSEQEWEMAPWAHPQIPPGAEEDLKEFQGEDEDILIPEPKEPKDRKSSDGRQDVAGGSLSGSRPSS